MDQGDGNAADEVVRGNCFQVVLKIKM
jgi:hypothetical protein